MGIEPTALCLGSRCLPLSYARSFQPPLGVSGLRRSRPATGDLLFPYNVSRIRVHPNTPFYQTNYPLSARTSGLPILEDMC